MKKVVFCLVAVLAFSGCSGSKTRKPQSESALSDVNPCETKVEDRTIWSLQKIAERKDGWIELNCLFYNQSIHIDQLPQGFSAGTGSRVFDLKSAGVSEVIERIVGQSWRGKIFFHSPNPLISRGLNRIRKNLAKPNGDISRMGSFVTQVLESHPLAKQVRQGANVMILNYANPVSDMNDPLEKALKKVQVYDLTVAVQGKNGPIFVGKTWLGKYKKNGEFVPKNPDRLIAWFFLDFSQEALAEQKASHWDQSPEPGYLEVPTLTPEQVPAPIPIYGAK